MGFPSRIAVRNKKLYNFFQAGAVARSGKCAFFALEVELKDGRDLAARDKTGIWIKSCAFYIVCGI